MTGHRAARRGWRSVRGVLAALVLVAAVIVAVTVAGDHRHTRTSGLSSAGGSSSPSPTPSGSPSAAGGTSPAPAASSSAATSPEASSPASPSTDPPTSSPAAIARPAVIVLNDSTISGLAHRAAAMLADRGWSIAAIGNLPANVAETTVYYAPAARSAARELAATGLGVRRVLPQSALPITWAGPLVVVLTSDSTLA